MALPRNASYLIKKSCNYCKYRLYNAPYIHANNKTLELTEDDITEVDTDAIVNAANASLILGAGQLNH